MENKEVVLIVLGVAVVALILALTFGRTSSPTGAQSAEELQAYIEAYGIDACIEKYGDACTSSQPNEEVQGDTPWKEPTDPNIDVKTETRYCMCSATVRASYKRYRTSVGVPPYVENRDLWNTVFPYVSVATGTPYMPFTSDHPGEVEPEDYPNINGYYTVQKENTVGMSDSRGTANNFVYDPVWNPMSEHFNLLFERRVDRRILGDGSIEYTTTFSVDGNEDFVSYRPKKNPGCRSNEDCISPCAGVEKGEILDALQN